ncbi:MAG TPA: response regulator transcription factor [Anaerolineae bacterium]|nr:response regulator transcription factor [Anaerolineae bacterium]
MSQRILVVDDDRQIVRLIRSYLEQNGFETLAAYEGTEALHLIRTERPDLVVLDLMLPGVDGWEITRIVRGDPAISATPIIMLTARVEDTDRIVGLEMGADDYIPKPFNPREVVARVRAVLRRAQGNVRPAHFLQVGPIRLDMDRHLVERDGQPLDLTPTEFELLHLLMRYPERAFTRMEMIDQALGYAYEGMERTIDSHIKNLRKKLGIPKGEPGYIETVYGVGYRLVGDA